MDIVKTDEGDYEKYEDLLLTRDQARKESGQIWTAYVSRFGQLISDLYSEEIECIKCRKEISYLQKAVNNGGVADTEAMQKWLESEMAGYYAELKRRQREYESCRNAEISSAYEVSRSKTLYRRLAKLLHPDMNPETDKRKDLADLWERTVTAYRRNDIKELSELEVLVHKALENSGIKNLDRKIHIPDIKEKIRSLENEIQDIIHKEPCTFRDILDDPESADKKEKELKKELDSYRKYRTELENEIDRIKKEEIISIRFDSK